MRKDRKTFRGDASSEMRAAFKASNNTEKRVVGRDCRVEREREMDNYSL